jgi:hypothetical protein
MRLFEVDQGSARDVLAVLQGLANRQGQAADLPFAVVMNILKPFALGISTPDGLIALKNQVDSNGDVIQDIKDDGTVVLNTNIQKPEDRAQQAASKTGGPTLDQMAKSNSNLTPKI